MSFHIGKCYMAADSTIFMCNSGRHNITDTPIIRKRITCELAIQKSGQK